MNRNILICHYRVGKTDGVSLEIRKRAEILEELGYQVFLLAGSGSSGADFIVPELDFDRPEVRKITENAFGNLSGYSDEDSLIKDIQKIAEILLEKLRVIVKKTDPEILLIHNIFSHGRHIASAMAFHTLIKELKVKTLATHHDFYWERENFENPCCQVIKDFLNTYIPPKLPNLKHIVISSPAAEELKRRTGISANIIPDTLDFSMKPWRKDEYNKDFLETFSLSGEDVLILQATRIVKRKGIELIIPVIKNLNKKEYRDRLIGKTLYNGKKFTEKSRFVYVLAGYAEQEAEGYFESITSSLRESSIPFRTIQKRVAADRAFHNGEKIYSLFDTYVFADIISYPSIFEGWGNQFIEAVFAKKPVIVFEYPVYKSDIKPHGYEVISLGSTIRTDEKSGILRLPEDTITAACENIASMLISPDTADKLDNNFRIGQKYNSKETLRKLLKENLELL